MGLLFAALQVVPVEWKPVADYDARAGRVLHRVSLQGDAPRGVPGSRFADR